VENKSSGQGPPNPPEVGLKAERKWIFNLLNESKVPLRGLGAGGKGFITKNATGGQV